MASHRRSTSTPTALAIDHVSPDALRPADYNPRTMSAAARDALRRGIETFGLVDPIIARASDGLVVGGHQRLAVALELQLPTVPVVYLDALSDQDAAALNVLLNNPNAQGAWDLPKLTALLSDLDAHGYDATLTGFDDAELERLLAGEVPGESATDNDQPAQTAEQWICAVTCRNETELAALYDELSTRGYACKLIT